MIMTNFDYLFQYLERENISIDKTEFLFQVQSHPDYPTLLSISDTLTFFDIENGVLKLDFDSFEFLPNRFVTFLDDSSQLYLVERTQDHTYIYFDSNKIKSLDLFQLKNNWREIVFLVEKPETEIIEKSNRKRIQLLFPALCTILLFVVLFLLKVDLKVYLFFIFPTVRIIFSIASLKNLFGTKSDFFNNFCNISSTSSCSDVLSSKKWKLFEYINLSDVSFVFFVFQFFLFFFSIIINSINDFFQIQKIFLSLAMPVILLSIYYQMKIEKKWCPICLSISLILIVELVFIHLLFSGDSRLSINYISITALNFSLVSYGWYIGRDSLTEHKNLKEFQLKANRFMRNYPLFKSSLLFKPKVELVNSPIVLGNDSCKTEITIITSPFCGHCKTAHFILEKIYESHREDIKIKIIINTNIDNQTEKKKVFFRILLSIYLQKGEREFIDALNYWFNNQSIELWLEKYKMKYNQEQIDYLYRVSNIWCEQNRFTFTPAIFINGYIYPKTHYREDLKFYINEIIEDEL